VGVDRHGDDRAGVPETLADNVHRLARQQQQGGVRVPEVVDPDRRQGVLA
jgi:hypothetical protein